MINVGVEGAVIVMEVKKNKKVASTRRGSWETGTLPFPFPAQATRDLR